MSLYANAIMLVQYAIICHVSVWRIWHHLCLWVKSILGTLKFQRNLGNLNAKKATAFLVQVNMRNTSLAANHNQLFLLMFSFQWWPKLPVWLFLYLYAPRHNWPTEIITVTNLVVLEILSEFLLHPKEEHTTFYTLNDDNRNSSKHQAWGWRT